MLIGLIGKKKEEEDGVVVRETEKHGFTRMLTLVPGIGAIIAFILTENMRNPMVFTGSLDAAHGHHRSRAACACPLRREEGKGTGDREDGRNA